MEKLLINFFNIEENNTRALRKYDEIDCKLQQLTGLNIEQLLKRFESGYALEPPKYISFKDIYNETI